MRAAKVPVGIAVAWLVASVVALWPASSLAADDPFSGSWVLDVATSKYPAGAAGPKDQTVAYDITGDEVKVTVTGTAANGQPIDIGYTGKLDGKDYPMTGNPDVDTQSMKRVNPNTMEITRKKDGKVVNTAVNVVSEDGKTRTVTTTVIRPDGQKITSVAVYTRQ